MLRQTETGRGCHLVSAFLMATSLLLSGCMMSPASGEGGTLVTKSIPSRVVTQIINNSCGSEETETTESLSTGQVKGLAKVINGFGVPYDERADNYTPTPAVVTDDSYEANKERGIGYTGIEDHYVAALAPGQSHSPDHPEHADVGAAMFTNLTTKEEQYGCAMRWEYYNQDLSGPAVSGYMDFLTGNGSGHMQYLAVHATASDKWVIVCPYDWGPALNLPTTGGGKYSGGRIGGLSPAAAEALGISGGDGPENAMTEWWWVENSSQVECGPIEDLSSLTKGSSSSTGTIASSSPTTKATARITTMASSTLTDIANASGAGDSTQVSIAPANANSFVSMFQGATSHGILSSDKIRYIVLQDTNTGTEDAETTLHRWETCGLDLRPHFIVGRDGTISQCVPLDSIAHHAGSAPLGANGEFSIMQERDDIQIDGTADHAMDAWSVGIALLHERDEGDYPSAQLNALDRLVAYVNQHAKIKPEIITKGEWNAGHHSKVLNGEMTPMTENDALVETPGAISEASDGQAQEDVTPQDKVDQMGSSVSGTFPTKEYKDSGNHSGTVTVADAAKAAEAGDCDDNEDDAEEASSGSGGTGIAKKAVEISGSASPESPIHGGWGEVPTDSRLATYVSEKNRVYPDVPGWADCGRCSATAVKASGADDSFPAHMDTAYQFEYMTNSNKWQRAGTMRTGDTPDTQCEPGDVLVTEGKGHIMIYVGNEAVKEKYPNSDANFFEGSLGDYYGWCYKRDVSYSSCNYAIFRCIQPDNATADDSSGGSSSTRQAIVDYCKKNIGASYDTMPSGGVEGVSYNCSFLATCAYKAAGLDIPHWQGHQNGDGSQSDAVRAAGNWTTDTSKLKPGDLVFFGSDPYNTGHVGVSLGGDQMIDSSYDGVAQRTLSGSFVGGGWPFPGDGGASESASSEKASKKKTTKSTTSSSSAIRTSSAVAKSSPWVKTDDAYLKEMIKKAEKYGSTTGWFCCVDSSISTDYGPRATVLHKVGGKWRVERGWNCIVGIRAQDADERGIEWSDSRSRSFKGVRVIRFQTAYITECNRYCSCYTVSQDPKYAHLPHSHDCQCFETQGFGDPWTLPKERRFRSAGCCGLREEDCKYIYSHCPLGTPVCVFDEAEPYPADYRDGAEIDPSNSDNGGTLEGDETTEAGGQEHINVSVQQA